MLRTIKCADCGEPFNHEYRSGRPPERCASCRKVRDRTASNERQRRWRQERPDTAREHDRRAQERRRKNGNYQAWKTSYDLARFYGITLEDYEAISARQEGRCAICAGPPSGSGGRLHVDHCHQTGKVRGLLCSKCNSGIGMLGDDPDRVARAADYLRHHR